MTRMTRYLLGLALALGVMGCTDGESASVGYLVGPAVEGVEYETATQRGVTDPEGRFRYEEDETIRFLLGDNLLGEVPATNEVTPFDLVGAPVVTGALRLCDALGNHNVFHSMGGVDHPCRIPVPPPRPNAAFNMLVNLVVLLQTLDADGEPENGIEITPEVRALIDDAKFDLTQPWRQFAEDFPFRRVIARANAEGLLTRAHGAINPAPALQQLYDALGIDPRINAVVLDSLDLGPDGVADEIRRMEYNAAGNWIHAEWDFNADGVVDGQRRWEYDADGNRTLYDVDDPDSNPTWEYDELGYLIRYTFANWTVTHERDEYGSVVRRTSEESGGDTHVNFWTYDEEGRPTIFVNDIYADDLPDRIHTWEYDAQGSLVREESDGGATSPDGVPDWVKEYDVRGNLVREELDENGDGVRESVVSWHYEYDTNGNATRSERDGDGDGVPESIVIYEYDANGNLTRSEGDTDADGVPESVVTREYDDAGNLIRVTFVGDVDQDGIQETQITEYGPDGRLKVEGVEFDEDGNPVRAPHGTGEHWVWTYDADNNLIHEENVNNNTGLPEYATTYEHVPTGFGYVIGEWPRD